MGFFKKRLTAIQTNFGSAHFFRCWSESPPRPPRGPEGAQGAPLSPPAPSWAAVGRCQAQVLEPLQQPPGPARSPPRVARPPPGLRPSRRYRWKARASASRTRPGRRPGGPAGRATADSAAEVTRKPGDATRKRTRARPVPGAPGPPRPARDVHGLPRPPSALWHARGGVGRRNGRDPRFRPRWCETAEPTVQFAAASRPARAQAVAWAPAGRAAPEGRRRPPRGTPRAQVALARPAPARGRATPAR